jgi:hypothetical protein
MGLFSSYPEPESLGKSPVPNFITINKLFWQDADTSQPSTDIMQIMGMPFFKGIGYIKSISSVSSTEKINSYLLCLVFK